MEVFRRIGTGGKVLGLRIIANVQRSSTLLEDTWSL